MIISIINQKGGVAKTVSTFNIASILASKGYKTLQIDLDPQGSLTIANGLEIENLDKTIYNAIVEKKDIKESIYELKENLYIAPSNIDLSVAELSLVNEIARENILKKAVRDIKEYFDFILIDCPPSLGLLTINALTASNQVLIPVATDYLSLRGLDLLLNTINRIKDNLNEDLKIAGILATMYDMRTKHSQEVLELLKEKFDVLGTISNAVIIKDSVLSTTPLIDFDPKHKTTKEYLRVTDNLLGAMNYE